MRAKVSALVDEWLGRDRLSSETPWTHFLRGRPHEALRENPEFADRVACLYPGLVPAPSPAGVEVTTGLEGTQVLAALYAGHDAATAVARAERVLRLCPMGEAALPSLVAALTTLVHADRADLAARWCDPLLEQTTTRCDPAWLAVFAAIRAEVAIRQGRFADAERCAKDALTHAPAASWGVALGLPLAAMTAAKTGLGKPEDAARYLAVPVPEAMFQTPVAPHYLTARGDHLLSLGAAEEALADFLACGDLLRGWGIDLPGIAAWRLGAARACLRLGRTSEARRFAEEQLDLLGPEPTRTRGSALRLRAAALPLGRRPEELEQAVEILQIAQDPYELAHALADAGAAYAELGDGPKARSAGRRARSLARSCGARPRAAARPGDEQVPHPVAREAAASVVGPGSEVLGSGVPEPVASRGDLSEAERRVATLAAQGQTNRQISGNLFVTVSTVEQHLTRIYRKLGVTRRADLPIFLD
ncbi:helix-turn-helix transcriptional regulator [Herbidospora sp. RD11066]